MDWSKILCWQLIQNASAISFSFNVDYKNWAESSQCPLFENLQFPARHHNFKHRYYRSIKQASRHRRILHSPSKKYRKAVVSYQSQLIDIWISLNRRDYDNSITLVSAKSIATKYRILHLENYAPTKLLKHAQSTYICGKKRCAKPKKFSTNFSSASYFFNTFGPNAWRSTDSWGKFMKTEPENQNRKKSSF